MRRSRELGAAIALGLGLAAGAASCVGNDPALPDTADGATSDSPVPTETGANDVTVDKPDGNADADAAPPKPCDVTKPFGQFQIVAGVNLAIADDAVARLTNDELTIYFSSNRTYGEPRLWYAKRDTKAMSFGAPQLVPINVDGGLLAKSPSPRPDGLYLFFESPPPPGFPGDRRTIEVVTRATAAASFGAPGTILAIQTPGEGDPYLATNGSAIYYVIDLQGHIYAAQAKGNDFDMPSAVNGLATPVSALDSAPVVTEDGLALYFASDRMDAAAKGGTEIWLATRTSTASDFSAPVLVPELNALEDDAPSWISPDKCTIYFTSTRKLSPADPPDHPHIFYATRSP